MGRDGEFKDFEELLDGRGAGVVRYIVAKDLWPLGRRGGKRVNRLAQRRQAFKCVLQGRGNDWHRASNRLGDQSDGCQGGCQE